LKFAFFNESKLWDKPKYEWTIEEWEEFFQLTKIKIYFKYDTRTIDTRTVKQGDFDT
jgi:spore coat polysaccharide biosynthesis protein SpsF (cytidylyltransferase family)